MTRNSNKGADEKTFRHIGREVLVKTLEGIDDELMIKRAKGELESKGKKGKYLGTDRIKTAAGEEKER